MTDDEITKLLFVREEPVSAHLGIVFASVHEDELARRTRRGIELYRAGFVPKLLLTGGGLLGRLRPEASRMVDIAREHGVPDRDVLVEDRSANTFQNVKYSLAVLESRRQLEALSTIVLVSSEWHMRRVLLTAKKYFPTSVRFVCCPSVEGCNRENWFKSETCRQVVLHEARILQNFRELGVL
jgi:uncharacterized SAM-binding protein YcdF (DUF218 family)